MEIVSFGEVFYLDTDSIIGFLILALLLVLSAFFFIGGDGSHHRK